MSSRPPLAKSRFHLPIHWRGNNQIQASETLKVNKREQSWALGEPRNKWVIAQVASHLLTWTSTQAPVAGSQQGMSLQFPLGGAIGSFPTPVDSLESARIASGPPTDVPPRAPAPRPPKPLCLAGSSCWTIISPACGKHKVCRSALRVVP